MSKLIEEKPEKEDLNNLDKKEETSNSSNPEIEKKYIEFDETTTNELIAKRKSHILWLIGFVGIGGLLCLMFGIKGTYENIIHYSDEYGKLAEDVEIMGFARVLLFLLIPAFGYVSYLLGMIWKNFPNPDDLKKFKEIEYAKITSENLSIKKKNGEISNDELEKYNRLLNQYKWAMLFIGFSFLMSISMVAGLIERQTVMGALIFFVFSIILLLVPYWYWNMRMDVLLEGIKKTIPWHKSPT
tara:strand:+ start:190 stop:915 length:726 start_codon:yes stop_codon:yes gene_type:complete